MVRLTKEEIDTKQLLDGIASHEAGATVLFLGTTRQYTAGRETVSLDYDCYPEMAIAKLEALRSHAMDNWSLVDCAIVHRLGTVGLGEISVAIATNSPHRRDAFEAGQWIIDRLKQTVPIWKKEYWADGTSEWIHPGGPEQAALGGIHCFDACHAARFRHCGRTREPI